MIKNYLKLALRNIAANKIYSSIHILGLTVGITVCMIIFLIIRHEYSYDRFHKDGDRIFRMYTEFKGIFSGYNRGVPDPVPVFVMDHFHGIEAGTHFHTWHAGVTIPEEFKEPTYFASKSDKIICGPEYFEVFSDYKWLAGNPKTSLGEPHRVVLTESKAEIYFGKKSSPDEFLGKEIIYNDSLTLIISGIVQDFSKNSDLFFQDFISLATTQHSWLNKTFQWDQWGNTNSSTQFFVKLDKNVSLSAIEEQLPLLQQKSEEMNPALDYRGHYKLQPFHDIHFNKNLGIFNGSRSTADKKSLRSMGLVALLLLLLASINFINLSTVQATRRAKEIGLRKVLGGSRKMLILQFLGESTVLSLFAVLLSIPLGHYAIQLYKEFIPDGMQFDLMDPYLIGFLILMILFAGILSGLYPAVYLSAHQPVKALKANMYSGKSDGQAPWLRKVLTVFQFSLSYVLIGCSLVIAFQINHMLKKDPGFNKDAIVNVYAPWWESPTKTKILAQEIERISGVEAITIHENPPAFQGYNTSTLNYKSEEGELKHNVHRRSGDENFIPFYGMEVLAGRNFLPETGHKEIIINETYAKELGFDPLLDALGQQLYMSEDHPYDIVGVIRDFHFQSLHHAIEPMFILYSTERSCVGIKFHSSVLTGNNPQFTFDKINSIWNTIYPNQAFQYHFLDESVKNFYKSEVRTVKLVGTATMIAIIISCLGLFSLVSFSTSQRTKEIGIRKVLGATIMQIVVLISKDFLKLVGISFLIALPFAWWLSHQWIDDYAYKVPISIWIFVLSGLTGILIALVTLGYKSFMSALANPVESLRVE